MQPTATQNIESFKKTKKIRFLFKAAAQILKEKRGYEMAYGGYCILFRPPSPIRTVDDEELRVIIDNFCSQYLYGFFYTREQLISKFGEQYDVQSLPSDFAVARIESIAETDDSLIIGEYADNSARIAHITKNACTIHNFYNQIAGVRHIHAIYYCRISGTVFVTTGDTLKLLDQWQIKENELVYVKRIKKRFAGYTAITKANDTFYFGTDFSSRPNYIESLDRKKHFFPKKAYYKHCLTLYSVLDRYVAAINTAMDEFGKQKTLSIFDGVKKEFIFCEEMEKIIEPYKDNSSRL